MQKKEIINWIETYKKNLSPIDSFTEAKQIGLDEVLSLLRTGEMTMPTGLVKNAINHIKDDEANLSELWGFDEHYDNVNVLLEIIALLDEFEEQERTTYTLFKVIYNDKIKKYMLVDKDYYLTNHVYFAGTKEECEKFFNETLSPAFEEILNQHVEYMTNQILNQNVFKNIIDPTTDLEELSK